MLGTWEELLLELKQRLAQCREFHSINKQLGAISQQLESLQAEKLSLDSCEENEALDARGILSQVIRNSDTILDILTDLQTSVQQLQSQVSATANVQKISLLCCCKQEISALLERCEIFTDELKISVEICDDAIEKVREINRGVSELDQLIKKKSWRPTSSMEPVSIEDINHLHNLLCELKSKKMIKAEFFDKNISILEKAEQHFDALGDEQDTGRQRSGLLFSCMPMMIVTSAIMVYNYCSPVSLIQKLCSKYYATGHDT